MNRGPIEIELRDDVAYQGDFNRKPKPKQKWEVPLYEDYLPPQYSGMNLPIELSQRRNLTIKALIVQLICIFAGFAFYFVRRMSLYLVANMLSLVFIYFGYNGTLRLEKWKIAAHSIFTMGVIGIFWAYLVLEALFMRNIGDVSASFHTSERSTLFLLALPYLIDLICGCVSMSLTYYIFKLEDTQEQLHKKTYDKMVEDVTVHDNYNPNSELCCVCINFKKAAVIYPCGHEALCNVCAKEFKQKNVQRCPICRSLIKDIINIYK